MNKLDDRMAHLLRLMVRYLNADQDISLVEWLFKAEETLKDYDNARARKVSALP